MKTKLILLSTLFCANYAFAQNFNKTPYIGSDGVMEAGKYIDFHSTDAGTSDYDVRLLANPGKLSIVGNMAIAPIGTTSDEVYNGSLMITKPTASGQYINLVRQGHYAWSLGTVYNTNNFAIGYGTQDDSNFINPSFTIDGSTGNIGLGTSAPSSKLDVNGDAAIKGNLILGVDQNISTISGPASSGAIQIKSNFANGGNTNRYIRFGWKDNNSVFNSAMSINEDLNVGIGTTSPQCALDVYGTIRAREILVNLNGTADFVFKDNYNLKPIQEVYNYAKENKHLPDIPSEAEVVKNGMNMGDFQVKLLQKVEELTLYMAQQDKTIQAQQAKIKELEKKINK
jgi:hypothetical protein